MPGYALGRGMGRKEGSEHHWEPGRHAQALLLPPPLFQARVLEQWNGKDCARKASTSSEGHLWGSSWEGVSPGNRLISKLHEQADSCRCCVELGHLVLVHNTP